MGWQIDAKKTQRSGQSRCPAAVHTKDEQTAPIDLIGAAYNVRFVPARVNWKDGAPCYLQRRLLDLRRNESPRATRSGCYITEMLPQPILLGILGDNRHARA
jgi:hypothetical protein